MADEESLEQQKLRAEINNLNRKPFATPAFWAPLITLGIALIVYVYTWKSGVFDEKQAHLNFVTDTLYTRKKLLDSTIKHLQDSLYTANIQLAKLQSDNKIIESVTKEKYAKSTPSQKELIDLRIENKNLLSENRRLFLSDSNAQRQIYNVGRQNAYNSEHAAGADAKSGILSFQISSLKTGIQLFWTHFNSVIKGQKSVDPAYDDLWKEANNLYMVSQSTREPGSQ
jgi:hypothetical protein